MNKVFLMGHLGKDPEVKEFSSGNKVCNFSLATNKTYKGKNGEKQQETTWHNCQAWNKTADLCWTYLKKGSFVFIEGEINVSSWENEHGEKRYNHRINVFGIRFLDRKEDGEQKKTTTRKTSSKPKEENQKMPYVNEDSIHTNQNFTSDDIPF